MYFFFYYPAGVEVDRKGRPWLTGLLILSMAVIFAWFRAFPLHNLLSWHLWVYHPGDGAGPGLVLSLLRHVNWVHLLGNLLYLWTFGPSLELALGRWRFLGLFLGAGVVGNLVQGLIIAFWMPHLADFGILGASGAISGLMALFLLRYPYGRIRCAWWLVSPFHGISRTGLVRIPSLIAILSWGLLQIVYMGAGAAGGGDVTAYGTHLGGFFGGLLLGWLLGLQAEGAYFLRRHRLERALSRGDWLGACEISQEQDLGAAGPETLTLAARAQRLAGTPSAARDLYQLAIDRAWTGGDDFGAAGVYAEALRFHPELVFPEQKQYRLALALDRLGREEACLRAIRNHCVLYPRGETTARLLLRAARIEEALDPDEAARLYTRHLENFPHSPFVEMARIALARLEAS